MKILSAIRREERKLEKQVGKLQSQLDGLRAAAKALGNSASNELGKARKKVISAAARAKMSRAAKKRWAKVKAGAKKAVS
jgi:prophage DNA circulation protein